MKQIFDDISQHTFHYLILGLFLVGGLAILVNFSPSRELRVAVIILIGYAYVLWGVVHHLATHRHLHAKIVVEYVLVAIVGMLLVYGVIGIH